MIAGHFSLLKKNFFLKSAEDNLQLDIQRGKLEMVFAACGIFSYFLAIAATAIHFFFSCKRGIIGFRLLKKFRSDDDVVLLLIF